MGSITYVDIYRKENKAGLCNLYNDFGRWTVTIFAMGSCMETVKICFLWNYSRCVDTVHCSDRYIFLKRSIYEKEEKKCLKNFYSNGF